QRIVIALRIAKDLNLNHYTSGAFARDETGLEVCPESDKACRWCATGAIRAASKYTGLTSAGRRRARELMYAVGLAEVINDQQRERLPELWDRVIVFAES